MFLEEHKAEVAFEYLIVLMMLAITVLAGITTLSICFKERSAKILEIINNGTNKN